VETTLKNTTTNFSHKFKALQLTFQVVSVEKFAFAHGQITLGQRCRVIAREVFHALLQVAQRLFMDGRSCEQVLEVLMPA